MPILSGASSGAVSLASKALTSAQILNLFTTPVTVVPAPGANNVLVPLGFTMLYRFVTTAYTDASGATFNLGTPTDLFVPSFQWGTFIFRQIADGLARVGSAQNDSDLLSFFSNQPLSIFLTGGALTDGDGTAIITVPYYTLGV